MLIQTSAEVLERAIGRVKELKEENSLLTQIQSPDGSAACHSYSMVTSVCLVTVSFDQLQQRVSQLAIQHITMVAAILDHLQKQQNTNSYTPEQLLSSPASVGHHGTPTSKPLASQISPSERVLLQPLPAHAAERLKFGIADLLPDTVSQSNSIK